jgi:hypothetical protein
MAAILLLEDGRGLYRSNLGYSVMLELIAEKIGDAHTRLRIWLADMADRTSPFCEFDLRGLTEDDRCEFWKAAARALAGLIEHHGPESTWAANMYGGESLAHLMRMHRSIQSGEPPSRLNDLSQPVDFNGEPEDLDLLWNEKNA